MTKRDVIADQLRRMIFAGEIPRGEKLLQDVLAERFSSSITPVREALRALEAEGLVVSEPHKGTRVAAADVGRIKAVYIVRRLTEGFAMRRAATRMSPRDIQRAETLLGAVDDAARAGDAAGIRAANREFHFFLYSHCNVPELVEHIATLWDAFPWDLVVGDPERTIASGREHTAMLEALRMGDAEAAGRATEEHIQHSFAAITERLLGTALPDPVDLDAD